MGIEIREIQSIDNKQVKELITSVMTEFGAVGEGYSIVDPELEDMTNAYNDKRSAFYVLVDGEKVLGCAGIGPLIGGNDNTCELKKMYFYPEIRSKGFGSQLLEKCLECAKEIGYQVCYIETLESMSGANKLYQKYGFEPSPTALGNTGHFKCNYWYTKDLSKSGT